MLSDVEEGDNLMLTRLTAVATLIVRRQCVGVRRCYVVQLGRYWETKDTKKRIKLALIIYRDFMQTFLSDFDRRSNINRKQLEP